MRTFAEQQKRLQLKQSTNLTASNTPSSGSGHEAHSLLQLQHTIGNQAVLRLAQDNNRIPGHASAPVAIQPKLSVNTPGDGYEQEADHIAEQVMRMPGPQLQRVQTKQVGTGSAAQTTVPSIVPEVLASPGEPLDTSTRAFFEPRFGHDFSNVRVHSTAAAQQSAREMNANAYTVGNNIVFGPGRFVPGSADGQRLVAHELAHVVQQSRGGEALMRDAAPAATGLAALPEQTRQSLSFDSVTTARNLRDYFGLPGEPRLAENVDEDFNLETPAIDSLKDDKVKGTLWRGLRAYARSLFDLIPGRDGRAHSTRFNMVHVENLNLTSWKGPDTAFRFTCIGGNTAGRIKVKIIIEQLDHEHQPMAADATGIESSKATPYGLKRGDAVPDPVWNKVLRALGKFPESLIMRIRNVTIATSGAAAGAGGHQAEFADSFANGVWTRQILLFRQIQAADDTSFAFLFAHELGHAINAAPTQGASGRVAAGYVYKDAGFQEAMRKDGGRGKRLSSYDATMTSDSEFFAECLAMYVQQPETLKLLRPHIYAWFVTYDAAALKDPTLNPHLTPPSK